MLLKSVTASAAFRLGLSRIHTRVTTPRIVTPTAQHAGTNNLSKKQSEQVCEAVRESIVEQEVGAPLQAVAQPGSLSCLDVLCRRHGQHPLAAVCLLHSPPEVTKPRMLGSAESLIGHETVLSTQQQKQRKLPFL